jgi:hypothetical protein
MMRSAFKNNPSPFIKLIDYIQIRDKDHVLTE